MGRKATIRSFLVALLLGVFVFSLPGPMAARAMSFPGGFPDWLLEEEEEIEEEEHIPFDYVHPTYKGIGYGTEWNYSLTFHYASQPLWLYGDGNQVMFRQQVKGGTATNSIQVFLWTRYVYDELALCMEPRLLDVLAQAGVSEILVHNGPLDDDAARQVLYLVEDLQRLMTSAESDPERIIQFWVGEDTGPRLVLKNWQRLQLEPEDDVGQALS